MLRKYTLVRICFKAVYMKKDEVPQDGDNLHHGTFKQLFYAVDASGDYTPVSGSLSLAAFLGTLTAETLAAGAFPAPFRIFTKMMV